MSKRKQKAKKSKGCVRLTITHEEFEILQDALCSYDDCGPRDEGWKSPELEALADRIYALWKKKHKNVLSKFESRRGDFDPMAVTASGVSRA
jgi:hypothetical protein